MIDTLNTIIKEYYEKMHVFKSLKHDVNDILSRLIEVNQIKVSNMTLRIKEEEALKNKVISKAKYNHLDDITDILGVRIITLFERDVDKIFQLIEENFEVVEVVDKRKKHKVNTIEFGYTSLHVIVKFTDERCKLVEYQDYQDIRFEIQLRTVLQHAWAEVEHGLGYKSFYEPPMEIKRKLNRLAATLELLDEEFEHIRYDIALYNQSLGKEEKVLKTDINKDSLIAFVNQSPLLKEMVESLAKEHNYQIVEDDSLISQQKIVAKLNFYGYQYIHELNDDMQKYQHSMRTIGEELSTNINYDSPILNRYSPLLWFSFIPVIVGLVIGHGSSGEDVVEDVIIETFRNNSLSVFDVFNQRKAGQ